MLGIQVTEFTMWAYFCFFVYSLTKLEAHQECALVAKGLNSFESPKKENFWNNLTLPHPCLQVVSIQSTNVSKMLKELLSY